MEARDWSVPSNPVEEVVMRDPQADAAKRVKKLIIEKSLTVSELSKRTGYSISYVSMVINGRRKNREVRDAIARALERSSQELWVGC
jgi:predicted transcriptional regulator